jgi:hypothetical protein
MRHFAIAMEAEVRCDWTSKTESKSARLRMLKLT